MDKIFVTSTKPVLIIKNENIYLQSLETTDLEIHSNNIKYILKNLRTNILKNRYNDYYKGIFDLYADHYTIISNQKDATAFNFYYGAIGFVNNDYVSISKKNIGQFSCKEYWENNPQEYFVVSKCQPTGSRFDVVVELSNINIKFPVTFSSIKNKVKLKNNGAITESYEKYDFKLLEPVYLGKTGKIFKKDITIYPGDYTFYNLLPTRGYMEIFNENDRYILFFKDGSIVHDSN